MKTMTAIAVVTVAANTAHAQEAPLSVLADGQTTPAPDQPPGDEAKGGDIVVTGSRIRQSVDAAASTPVLVLNAENFGSRGFTQAGDALQELTTNAPVRTAIPALANGQATTGADYPNLFNLGPARTLTLINGRRTVPTSLGLGDEAVDTNIIPLGLLDRIEAVQGGGAAVYGSGAIAGVVNYILKKNFQGVTADAQYTLSSRQDYRVMSGRLVAGKNFADGRGNIALEFDYSKSDPVVRADRPGRFYELTGPNPAPGAGANGVPISVGYFGVNEMIDSNGVINLTGSGFTINNLLRVGSNALTIDGAGNIVPKFPGNPIPGQPAYLSDSQLNWPFFANIPAVPGVRRLVGSAIGHYDLTDHLRFQAEISWAQTRALYPTGSAQLYQFQGALAGPFPNLAPLPFTKDNPYLSAATIQTLSSLSPAFAAGQPLYLAKNGTNFDPINGDAYFTTTTLRAQAGVAGDFKIGSHQFDWDLSYSHGEAKMTVEAYAMIFPNFRNAANVVTGANGQPVCAINFPVVTDARCIPINIFGDVRPSQAAMDYTVDKGAGAINGAIGNTKNRQDDFLATVSGDIIRLPAGAAKFSVSYEHRAASAKFIPYPGDAAGIHFSGQKSLAGSGSYVTNEFAGELAIPLLGEDFKIPLVEALDLNGSYRLVNNSLAGSNSVWGGSLRWKVGLGLTLRASRSRNFRAPSINQFAQPATNSISNIVNPCSRTQIGNGPAPATRAANCLALFTANPTYGLNILPVGVANTPANRLSNFAQTNTAQVIVTTGGNPDLQNETSNTTTFGFVFQPSFVPGLTVTADRIDLKMDNALSLFGPSNFAASCFDASPQPAQFCSGLTFDADGNYTAAPNKTVNAARLRFKADTFNVDYRLSLSKIAASLPGSIGLTVSATHNRLSTIVFAGTTTRSDDTVTLPKWSGHLDARYINGPFKFVYSINYLSAALLSSTATVNNSPNGIYRVGSNTQSNFTVEYTFDSDGRRLTLRAGVVDAFDRMNSFPVLTYGDIIGRRFFVGASTKF